MTHKKISRAIVAFFVISTGTCIASEIPSFPKIDITSQELQVYLTGLKNAATNKDYRTLCSEFIYPIEVTTWNDSEIRADITVKNERACMAKKTAIFDTYLLNKILAITADDLSETKAMVMVYNGTLWLSRCELHEEDPRSNDDSNLHNDYYWPIKIVNINKKFGESSKP